MNIAINKDIEKYQENVIFGLTAKQLIFSAVSIVIGGGIVLITYKYLGLTVSAYIAIPAVAPIALNGFYEYQGMSFTQMFIRKLKVIFANKDLSYISEEGEGLINLLRLEDEANNKTRSKKSKGKTKQDKQKKHRKVEIQEEGK